MEGAALPEGSGHLTTSKAPGRLLGRNMAVSDPRALSGLVYVDGNAGTLAPTRLQSCQELSPLVCHLVSFFSFFFFRWLQSAVVLHRNV